MSKVLARHEVPAELKWRLEEIYASDELFEQDLAKAKDSLAGVGELRGTITSKERLLHALRRRDELAMLIDRIFAYAYMRRDEDNSNSKYQAYADQALSLMVMANSASAFLEPEILSLDSAVVWEWVEAEPGLKPTAISPQHPSPKSPYPLCGTGRALGRSRELGSAPGVIFGMFNDADLKFRR